MVKAAVVVMGDLGRSPRMNYHCLSISKLPNASVDFIGFKGTTCRNEILESPNITLHQMDSAKAPSFVERNFALRALFKVFSQSYWLLSVLFSIQRPDFIICQTPPFLPVIPLLLFYCFICRSKLIIDWHNFGYTLIGEKHKIIRFIYKKCEKFFGYYAHGNLCVTKAMQKELLTNWNIKAHVLYDRAPTFFRETTTEEKHQLFLELREDIKEIEIPISSSIKEQVKSSTPFTIEYNSGVVELRKDRPALLVSSTSWTDDEDFSILLDSLNLYNSYLHSNNNNNKECIKLVAIITGKGPNKKYYEKKISEMKFNYIKVVTLWLSAKNYPLLLGSSDLGVSLHLSSSGLDLPMKVVDMFGANLPVVAVGFKCLDELVQDSKNGLIFHSSDQLFKQLKLLFDGFPNNISTLNTLREGTKEFQKIRWEDNWNDVVSPLLMS